MHLPPKASLCQLDRCRGLTLIEITLALALMLTLASIITYSISAMSDWRKGREAAEQLKAVYLAQKSYLADHPTETPNDFTSGKLIPYLPGRPGAMPTVKSLEDQDLTVKIDAMPPAFQLGESTYDPTDSSSDGLWDVSGL